jgi:mono/diheme cytochrome c family protein
MTYQERHMSCHSIIVYLLLISVLAAGIDTAESGDRVLPGNHPLTQSQAGGVLISELRCAACHSGLPQVSIPEKTAPELDNVGARLSPVFIQQFLASPSSVHSGTTMPDLLASRPPAEREQIAEALTHFLVSLSTSNFSSEVSDQVDSQRGQAMYHSIGCVACHGPRESAPIKEQKLNPLDIFGDAFDEEEDKPNIDATPIKPIAVPLGHVANKYSIQSLSDFLFQPLQVRASGRMPDMKLTPSESLAIAGYLIGQQPQKTEPLRPQQSLVIRGEQYFKELNCAACHSLATVIPKPASLPLVKIGRLTKTDFATGCLSEKSTTSPRYKLTDAEVQAIVAAIIAEPQPESDERIVSETLTVFNCVACHIRDGFGGVHESYDPFFSSSEQKLGDDGRIPPPLTLVGAKLQPAWMKKVLFDGESVRPYMATRMPQYGVSNLHHLPTLLSRLDVLESTSMTIPNPESRSESEREHEKLLRAAGRELLGDKGLNCVACHQFNGKSADGNQGIDLTTSFQRLQPGWFNRYLRNPGAFRPRTVMPTAWPDGEATLKTILSGDTDAQIEAIWYYLSLGTSAADPPGIRGVSTKIVVDGQTQTYRGRSRVAGFRGIAVGFPERLSYAFNAETGSIAAIWQGDFIGVNWSGQGSGEFNPASEPILLPQDVSFTQLEDDNAPWPLMPVMTKESRTNPDPLYPKNVGYQFRGYYFDNLSIPIFQYRSGTIEIEDRVEAVESEKQTLLKRVFRFESPESQVVWFRPLDGDITRESDRVFQNGKVRLTIPGVESILRTLSDNRLRTELLLRLQIPQGQSTLEFLYEPLK